MLLCARASLEQCGVRSICHAAHDACYFTNLLWDILRRNVRAVCWMGGPTIVWAIPMYVYSTICLREMVQAPTVVA